jgi:hypothetical protein
MRCALFIRGLCVLTLSGSFAKLTTLTAPDAYPCKTASGKLASEQAEDSGAASVGCCARRCCSDENRPLSGKEPLWET